MFNSGTYIGVVLWAPILMLGRDEEAERTFLLELCRHCRLLCLLDNLVLFKAMPSRERVNSLLRFLQLSLELLLSVLSFPLCRLTLEKPFT